MHLVLARIEGAPEGTKGISLFVVPKFLPSADGGVGARNAVSCGSIEEKMGIHGNATCVMNYDGATGWLVGEANRGLQAMFVMMNEARLDVGLQGLALSEVAYQNAAAYAKERLAGRALTGAKFPDKPADPIIVHPDVRRMLMTIRAFNEAARALVLWTALKSDVAHRSEDANERASRRRSSGTADAGDQRRADRSGLRQYGCWRSRCSAVTAISPSTAWNSSCAMRGSPMIYEGANGIQALDLVGRKLPKDGGRALQAFFGEVSAYIKDHGADAAMTPYTAPLGKALGELQAGDDVVCAECHGRSRQCRRRLDRLHAALRLGRARLHVVPDRGSGQSQGNGADERMAQRLMTGRYFMERVLPASSAHLARIKAGAASTMALPLEAF